MMLNFISNANFILLIYNKIKDCQIFAKTLKIDNSKKK